MNTVKNTYKIISGFLSLIILLCVIVSVPKVYSSAENEYKLGDTNHDSKINAVDLLCMRKLIVHYNIVIDEDLADINRDGNVNAVDILLLKKYIVGIYTYDDLINGNFKDNLGTLSVDFIDVGQADCAVISCGGEYMMIDGGNVADSSLVYSYLESHKISYLKYMICTHAHEDHVGGLSGALNYATVGTAYCPVTTYTTKAFKNFVSYLAAQNKTITMPTIGEKITLGKAEITFIAPLKTNYSNINNTSIVVKIVFGSTSFLFTGDAENEAENDILNSGADISATVLKVGHHGSKTSSSANYLQAVKPKYAVISVGLNNSYSHPDDGTLSRLLSVGAKIYRTDQNGTVYCQSNGKSVTFSTEK